MPYLIKPSVFVPVAVLFSIIIPLLEEFFKPLAVWLLANRLDSAGQGFALGALSGASFAIIETFNVSAQMVEWGELLFTRIGTGLLHITTSALMGGAIYLAFRERRYLRLFATYLLVVLLHGLWNFGAVANSFSGLLVSNGGLNTDLPAEVYQTIQTASAVGLVVLTIVLLALLILGNRRRAGDMSYPGETIEK
jgi:RsiW-degrading membrane proteinase PrsW (M82 family)